MPLIDQWTLSQDATFQKKVAAAAIATALTVQGESPTGFTAKQYGKRQALARSIITDPSVNRMQKLAVLAACGSTPALTATSPDLDIVAAVVAAWDDVAGVDASDLV